MPPVTFTGYDSAMDRVIFTNHGPIMKAPIPILSGSDLRINSPNQISSSSSPFIPSHLGKLIKISGSPGGRNDGIFSISKVINSSLVEVSGSNLTHLDEKSTESSIIRFCNDLKSRFNSHIVLSGPHNSINTSDIVSYPQAVDIISSSILLNQIRSKFNDHISRVPPVHKLEGSNFSVGRDSDSISSIIILANSLRSLFDSHVQSSIHHFIKDSVNSVRLDYLVPTLGIFPGLLTGPFGWQILNPRYGEIADDPSDVVVRVNNSPVLVERVSGLLGAIVLGERPNSGDSVVVDYSYIEGVQTQIMRLNSPEFNLNQYGNRALVGIEGRKYRASSTLLDTSKSLNTVYSSNPAGYSGWKYKGFEREYSSVLNDPSSLVLNNPQNILKKPNKDFLYDFSVFYDPIVLPNDSRDPWKANGDVTGSQVRPSTGLRITDSSGSSGGSSDPPFYSHDFVSRFPSSISFSFRVSVENYIKDGDFTGVCSGFNNAPRSCLVGFLETESTNLSSLIYLGNSLKSKFNSHVSNSTFHNHSDSSNLIVTPDSSDLASAILLINSIAKSYENHLSSPCHVFPDVSNSVIHADVFSLEEAISIANSIRLKFNLHIDDSSVHKIADKINNAHLVKQVGILTNRGHSEEWRSWDLFQADWSEEKTYRILQKNSGEVSLFIGFSTNPSIITNASSLPFSSNLDMEQDSVQNVFFGSIGKESTSTSFWKFVKFNSVPEVSNNSIEKKKCSYDSSSGVTPENTTSSPWIPIGDSNFERISGNGLTIDSIGYNSRLSDGKVSDSYRGYLRVEPSLLSNFGFDVEFRSKIGYFTHSLNNLAAGVFIDDTSLSTHLCFLQFSPTSASILGSNTAPFFLLNQGDDIILSVDDNDPKSITFSESDSSSTSTQIVSLINSAVGFNIASTNNPTSGKIRLSSNSLGSSSSINLISGSALSKIGFSAGKYVGKDSNPDPKFSWDGSSIPSEDMTPWDSGGGQLSSIIDDKMRINDNSSSDFLSFTQSDERVIGSSINSSIDWKLDFKVTVQEFTPGISSGSYRFCGVLVNVDEGPSGKNLEVHFSYNNSGFPYIRIMTYDSSSNSLVEISSSPFSWNDKKIHSVNIYTSKNSNVCILEADSINLSNFAFSSLLPGVVGPQITIGSGGSDVSNLSLLSSNSIVDWHSVSIFRDSKIGDPSSSLRKYIGLYKGGDQNLSSSYYLSQVNWLDFHNYRVVKDPFGNISVFIDNNPTPSISVGYDFLSVPPSRSSFFYSMSGGSPCIAFGSFDDSQVCRSVWDYIEYSAGPISINEVPFPPFQVLNRSNQISSPEKLKTDISHDKFGFSVYSEGCPSDDFIGSESLDPTVILGENVPPVPMTQNLENRGGLEKTYEKIQSFDSIDFVDKSGAISDFEDDKENSLLSNGIVEYPDFVQGIIDNLNTISSTLLDHSSDTSIHSFPQSTSFINFPCNNLNSAILLYEELRLFYNSHIQSSSHSNTDNENSVEPTSVFDIYSLSESLKLLTSRYKNHERQGRIHSINDSSNTIQITTFTFDIQGIKSILESIAVHFNSHLSQSLIHLVNDSSNVIGTNAGSSITQYIAFYTSLRNSYISHSSNNGGTYHGSIDPDDVAFQTSLPTNYESLILCVEEIVRMYNIHIKRFIPVHPVSDSVNGETLPGPLSSLITTMGEVDGSLGRHRRNINRLNSSVLYHRHPDFPPSSFPSLVYNTSKLIVDFSNIRQNIKKTISDFNSHITSGEHKSPDSIHEIEYPLEDTLSHVSSFRQLVSSFNQHISGVLWHTDSGGHEINYEDSPDITSDMKKLISELISKFNNHIVRTRSHKNVDINNRIEHDTMDYSNIPYSVNSLKRSYSSHILSNVHLTIDGTNTISSPDATDVESSILLLNEINEKYNAHLVQSGVHGNSVLVKFKVPDRVLYRHIKFFEKKYGKNGDMSPFSDSVRISSQVSPLYGSSVGFIPSGNNPIENYSISSSITGPYDIISGDILNIKIGDSLYSIIFQSGDTSASSVSSRINLHVGSTIAYSPQSTLVISSSSFISVLGGSASQKLGLSGSSPIKFNVISGDPSSVSMINLVEFGQNITRIESTSDSNAVLGSRTSIFGSQNSYSISFSIRITSPNISDNGDSGVCVGVSSPSGNIHTFALKFEYFSGIQSVRVIDWSTNREILRKNFEWNDNSFHSYTIKKVKDGRVELSITLEI
jgi:hypothetical protein